MEMFDCPVGYHSLIEVNNSVACGRLSEGAKVKRFEDALAEHGLRNPVCTNSGTSALEIALRLAGVGPGDDVILPAQTFIATATAVLHCGARVIFADVDPETGLLDPNDALQRWTPNCRVIVAVYWCGLPVKMSMFSTGHGTTLIADAAQALGATHFRQPVSDWADYTALSFQATKHVTTGDGGAVCCSNPNDVSHARRLRWFGMDRTHPPGPLGERECVATDLGGKWHMNDVAASIGLGSLRGFPGRLERRQAVGARYRDELKNIPGLKVPRLDPDRTHAYYAFPVLVERRDDFAKALLERGFPCSVIARRIDRHPVFGGLRDDLPGTDHYDRHQINLPCHSSLNDDDVGKVIEAVRRGW